MQSISSLSSTSCNEQKWCWTAILSRIHNSTRAQMRARTGQADRFERHLYFFACRDSRYIIFVCMCAGISLMYFSEGTLCRCVDLNMISKPVHPIPDVWVIRLHTHPAYKTCSAVALVDVYQLCKSLVDSFWKMVFKCLLVCDHFNHFDTNVVLNIMFYKQPIITLHRFLLCDFSSLVKIQPIIKSDNNDK